MTNYTRYHKSVEKKACKTPTKRSNQLAIVTCVTKGMLCKSAQKYNEKLGIRVRCQKKFPNATSTIFLFSLFLPSRGISGKIRAHPSCRTKYFRMIGGIRLRRFQGNFKAPFFLTAYILNLFKLSRTVDFCHKTCTLHTHY